jgi:hypothetical protein
MGMVQETPEVEIMLPFTLALLLAAPPSNPLPDGKTIDTFRYSFSNNEPLGPAGQLSISAEGKVEYFHATAPATGSGGIITNASWEIPKTEATELFRKLVADGLLTLPEPNAHQLQGPNGFTVTSGRWCMSVNADPIPDKLLGHLRAYLEKAHPLLWKPVLAAQPKDGKPNLTQIRYAFTEKVNGPEIALLVTRDGKVTFSRTTPPTAPGGQKTLSESWTIPAKDAAAMLDALVTDGLFDLADTAGQQFPNHLIEATAGRWQQAFSPKEMPDSVMKHLKPLLEKSELSSGKR